MSKITKGRKAAYYTGMALIALGFILFISTFISVASHINDPLSFIDGRGTPPFANSVIGIILIIIGSVVMSIGARGPAGSGLLLDPKKAREDLKPFSEAKGEMINDVISNIDAVDRIVKSSEAKEVIKIKCRNCGALNDEDAKFCKNCGREL
ncbi:MAG: zinc ribbon domain-containing protein [Clostridiales bacterium]|jgi:hypothetical protein|nr:zinc ribbon domain-containing protein [Clostridiales bacterium]